RATAAISTGSRRRPEIRLLLLVPRLQMPEPNGLTCPILVPLPFQELLLADHGNDFFHFLDVGIGAGGHACRQCGRTATGREVAEEDLHNVIDPLFRDGSAIRPEISPPREAAGDNFI